MPPVDVHPVVWTRGRSTVQGRAVFVRRGPHDIPGVEVPAQVAAFPDGLLRELLGLTRWRPERRGPLRRELEECLAVALFERAHVEVHVMIVGHSSSDRSRSSVSKI